ncbi:MAG: DnaJ C-terminal domain-containing protein [Candidatus Symbiobacter sp.]|nr:DnaJ C-terminal domain-containing protein [Candidatus Symbiobacter sp.]
MRNPYDVLGVEQAASPETIKHAYRKLVKQFHPDLHPGDAAIEARFKEISAAYDLLSDAKKRERFDRGEIDANGSERGGMRGGRPGGAGGFQAGFGGGRAGPGFNPGVNPGFNPGFNPHFNQGFGGGRGGAGGGPSGTPGGTPGGGTAGGPDIDDIFDMFKRRGGVGGGAGDFAGAGGASPGRRGSDINYALTIDFKSAALGSKRRLSMPDKKDLDIVIPPGTEDGATLRLRGQGQPGFGGEPDGDAMIQIQVEPHLFFERRGPDIHLEVPVTLDEAVLGATITVPTLEGTVSVKVPKGSNSGTILRLRQRGIQHARNKDRGDQYVKLVVILPDMIDNDLAQFLEKWKKEHSYHVRARLGVDR